MASMTDESEVKSGAIGNLRKMLKDGRAKRLGTLAAPAEKALGKTPDAGAVEIHVIKGGVPEALTHEQPVEGSPGEEGHESPLEASLEGDEPKPEARAISGSVHAAVMKKLDQVLRPKKG